MFADNLAYVALVVGDAEAAASIFEHSFGLQRFDCPTANAGRRLPVLGIGDSALVLVEPGDSFVDGEARVGVHHIALGVPDITAGAEAVSRAGIEVAEGITHDGLDGTRRLRLSPAVTAGVQTYIVEPIQIEVKRTHTFVERLDHIGVASADNAMAVDVFSKRLGCTLESTQTDMEMQIAVESFTSDKYGVVYHSRPPVPIGGLRVTFITVGDCELEFLQDFDPRSEAQVVHGQSGNTRQDRGAIARYVASRGPGLHHLAFKVTDINACLASLEAAGHTLIDKVGRSGSRRALIGFIHPKSLYGVLVHLVQRDEY